MISPLLAMLTGSVGPAEIGDASTLFSICQRIAGSLGVGLIAAVYALPGGGAGPILALHVAGIVIAAIAAAGLLAAPRCRPNATRSATAEKYGRITNEA